MENIILIREELDCKINIAFKLFTINDLLERWLTEKAEVEPKIGGKYELYWEPENRKNNSTIGCKISGIEKNKFISFHDILNELGIRTGDLLLTEYMKREMKTITKIIKDDLISWLKPYARMLIKNSNSASELLDLLNWDEGLTEDYRVHKLFGMDFKQAKMNFTSGVLNK